jgi:peptidoglycan/xylan/chitin deacetylase (PgdA/CDA1 family)
MRPHGVMFHHFHDHQHPVGQGSISAQQLENLILHIGPEQILPARQWMHDAIAGRLRPNQLCLTFDDNLRCQYDVAVPVLRRFGLTAFFFVYTSVLQGNIERLEVYRHFRTTRFTDVDDFYASFFVTAHELGWGSIIDTALHGFKAKAYLAGFPFYSDNDRRFRFVRDEVLGPDRYGAVMDRMLRDAQVDVRQVASQLWMTEQHVRELHAQGNVIGLHSHTHPTRLDHLEREAQRYEYRENHQHLHTMLSEKPLAMSHPCNAYDNRTLDVLRGLGIKLGFRANMALRRASELEYPREDHTNLVRQLAA